MSRVRPVFGWKKKKKKRTLLFRPHQILLRLLPTGTDRLRPSVDALTASFARLSSKGGKKGEKKGEGKEGRKKKEEHRKDEGKGCHRQPVDSSQIMIDFSVNSVHVFSALFGKKKKRKKRKKEGKGGKSRTQVRRSVSVYRGIVSLPIFPPPQHQAAPLEKKKKKEGEKEGRGRTRTKSPSPLCQCLLCGAGQVFAVVTIDQERRKKGRRRRKGAGG